MQARVQARSSLSADIPKTALTCLLSLHVSAPWAVLREDVPMACVCKPALSALWLRAVRSSPGTLLDAQPLAIAASPLADTLVPLLLTMQERGLVERHGVRVRVLGDLTRLPPEVQSAALDVMAATAHHTRGVLNICFAYSCACPRWPAANV